MKRLIDVREYGWGLIRVWLFEPGGLSELTITREQIETTVAWARRCLGQSRRQALPFAEYHREPFGRNYRWSAQAAELYRARTSRFV